MEKKYKIITGDSRLSLKLLEDASVQTIVTSPPYYGLRDYGMDEQIGQEETPEIFVETLVNVFREAKRVLREDGTLWINIGDTYSRGNRKVVTPPAGILKSKRNEEKYSFVSASAKLGNHPDIKPKDLIGIPWMLALALRRDGWYLRQDIIWSKPSPMPESVTDRCTRAHEYIFMFTKNPKYLYKASEILENGLNKRSVWTVKTSSYDGAHFATYPPELIRPCILSSTNIGDVVLDLFNGSGTTGYVALQEGRKYIGIELNPEYVEIANNRLEAISLQGSLEI
jgi:site-specific DNA-methyltransferase (adenine-specific)